MTAIPDTASPSPSTPLATVALVTLGCARNEVDSEELAGRLEAGGFRLVDDPEDADTVVVNTCGFVEAAKKDSVDTLLAGLRPEGRRVRRGRRRGRLHGRALRQGPRRVAARGRRGARLRRLPRHRRPAAVDPGRGAAPPAHPAGPPPAAADLARPTATPRAWSCPGTRISAPDLPAGAAPDSGPRAVRRRLDGGPMAPLKLASGCDRRCSFCAIPSFRGSFVSPPSQRRARRGPLARRAGRQGAVPGQRELHVVRQGPRRPAAARDAAARARGRRRRRAGPGLLPPARRDPARPGRPRSRARRASRRTSTCPSSTPRTPCSAGCAASATRRASSACSSRSARRPRWPASAPT